MYPFLYLDGYKSFQDSAVDLLAIYMVKSKDNIIKLSKI
jgi:hypothetical protein